MPDDLHHTRSLEAASQQTPAPDGMAAVAQPDARIDVGAQLISLDAGLFSVSVAPARSVRTEGGMVLPCVRFDVLPRRPGQDVYIAALSETSLLLPGAPPAYLRIAGGRTAVLLTTYKAAGAAPPPEIHITLVQSTEAPTAVAAATAAAQPTDALPSAALSLTAHVQGHGDLHFPGGAWAGAPNGEGAIEGFAISAGTDLPPASLEYRAMLGRDWLSPWMAEGEFCGSRQMALALLGACVQLRGPAAAEFVCRVWGRFAGVEHGPFEDGALCEAGGAELTGLRVVIERRGKPQRARTRRSGA